MKVKEHETTSPAGQHEAGDALVMEFSLDAPARQVWRALTEPELLARWLMPNDLRAKVGEHFTFEQGQVRCEVLDVEPERFLRYRWQADTDPRDPLAGTLDTVVSFELAMLDDGGTRLRIAHRGFDTLPEAANDRFMQARLVA